MRDERRRGLKPPLIFMQVRLHRGSLVMGFLSASLGSRSNLSAQLQPNFPRKTVLLGRSHLYNPAVFLFFIFYPLSISRPLFFVFCFLFFVFLFFVFLLFCFLFFCFLFSVFFFFFLVFVSRFCVFFFLLPCLLVFFLFFVFLFSPLPCFCYFFIFLLPLRPRPPDPRQSPAVLYLAGLFPHQEQAPCSRTCVPKRAKPAEALLPLAALRKGSLPGLAVPPHREAGDDDGLRRRPLSSVSLAREGKGRARG